MGKKEKKTKKAKKAKIFGVEIQFDMKVPMDKLPKQAKKIWEKPNKFSDFKKGSDASYYQFLKYLWIEFPDGSEQRLADYVNGRICDICKKPIMAGEAALKVLSADVHVSCTMGNGFEAHWPVKNR